MNNWITLLQSLVWPIFLGVLIYVFRDWFKAILAAIRVRIEQGSELGVGPGGLTLGVAPRLPDDPTPEEIIDDGEVESTQPELLEREKALEREEEADPLKTLHLIHRTRFLRVKNGRNYYRIVVSLAATDPEALNAVERVVYYLHRTFRNPVREVRDATKNFTLKTAAWGEFTIRADVHVKDNPDPIRLSRYLDIQPSG